MPTSLLAQRHLEPPDTPGGLPLRPLFTGPSFTVPIWNLPRAPPHPQAPDKLCLRFSKVQEGGGGVRLRGLCGGAFQGPSGLRPGVREAAWLGWEAAWLGVVLVYRWNLPTFLGLQDSPQTLWSREVAKARSSMSDGRGIAGMAVLCGTIWSCLLIWLYPV